LFTVSVFDIESGFGFKSNLFSKETYLSKCTGKVRFKAKFDWFNSGVNPDFSVNFGFNPEITLKYGLQPQF